MPTCLADLLAELSHCARESPPSARVAADAAAAIGYLGRAMNRMNAEQRRTPHGTITQVLAGACAVVERGTFLQPSRLADLAGAAADTVDVLDDELTPRTRSAIAIAVAEVLDNLADAYRSGKQSLDHVDANRLSRLDRALTNMHRGAALDPPKPEAAAILHRPIPGGTHGTAEAAHDLINAAAGLVHYSQPHRQISLSELLAVTIASDSLTRSAHRLLPDSPVPTAWRRVQHEFRPFTDGTRRAQADRSPLVAHALDLHRSATSPRPGERNASRLRATRYALDQLTTVAHNLSGVVEQWGMNRFLRAYAIDLDAGERYPGEFLAGHRAAGIVAAGPIDLAPVQAALRDTGSETTALARSLGHVPIVARAARRAAVARDEYVMPSVEMAPARPL